MNKGLHRLWSGANILCKLIPLASEAEDKEIKSPIQYMNEMVAMNMIWYLKFKLMQEE